MDFEITNGDVDCSARNGCWSTTALDPVPDAYNEERGYFIDRQFHAESIYNLLADLVGSLAMPTINEMSVLCGICDSDELLECQLTTPDTRDHLDLEVDEKFVDMTCPFFRVDVERSGVKIELMVVLRQ